MEKNPLINITYGMYLIGSKYKEKYSGMIATTVCQTTSEPETITVAINKNNYTHGIIEKSKKINVSILSKESNFELIGKFGFKTSETEDKLVGVNYVIGKNDIPVVITDMIAFVEAKVIGSFDAGTHTIFLAKVTNSENINSDLEPMTYEYYHTVIKGKSPKNASTYSLNSQENKEEEFNKYKCQDCGYVYSELDGDQKRKIKEGTKFEDLPETWSCPVCGATKETFKKL